MTEAVPKFLVSYLQQRQTERANRVHAVLASLTRWEQLLVHDAAVMGYVQGMRHPDGEPIGKDRQTIAHVIDACLAFPDLYPAINALEAATERRETVEYFVQCQQPDGTWEQASGTTEDPAFVLERLAARRRAQPDFEYRIARRTTTVRVETFDVPDSEETSCTECEHPKGQHSEADEPVSVGLCHACDEDGNDDAWHNYEPAAEI